MSRRNSITGEIIRQAAFGKNNAAGRVNKHVESRPLPAVVARNTTEEILKKGYAVEITGFDIVTNLYEISKPTGSNLAQVLFCTTPAGIGERVLLGPEGIARAEVDPADVDIQSGSIVGVKEGSFLLTDSGTGFLVMALATEDGVELDPAADSRWAVVRPEGGNSIEYWRHLASIAADGTVKCKFINYSLNISLVNPGTHEGAFNINYLGGLGYITPEAIIDESLGSLFQIGIKIAVTQNEETGILESINSMMVSTPVDWPTPYFDGFPIHAEVYNDPEESAGSNDLGTRWITFPTGFVKIVPAAGGEPKKALSKNTFRVPLSVSWPPIPPAGAITEMPDGSKGEMLYHDGTAWVPLAVPASPWRHRIVFDKIPLDAGTEPPEVNDVIPRWDQGNFYIVQADGTETLIEMDQVFDNYNPLEFGSSKADWSLEFKVENGKLDPLSTTGTLNPKGVSDTEISDGDASSSTPQTFFRIPIIRAGIFVCEGGSYRENLIWLKERGPLVELI